MRQRSFKKINEIWRANSIITSEDLEIKQEAIECYKGLLTIDQRNSPKDQEVILQCIPNLITDKDNKVM